MTGSYEYDEPYEPSDDRPPLLDPAEFESLYDQVNGMLGDRVISTEIYNEWATDEAGEPTEARQPGASYPVMISSGETSGIPTVNVVDFEGKEGMHATVRRVSSLFDEVIVDIGRNHSTAPRLVYSRAVFEDIIHNTELTGLRGEAAASVYGYVATVADAIVREIDGSV